MIVGATAKLIGNFFFQRLVCSASISPVFQSNFVVPAKLECGYHSSCFLLTGDTDRSGGTTAKDSTETQSLEERVNTWVTDINGDANADSVGVDEQHAEDSEGSKVTPFTHGTVQWKGVYSPNANLSDIEVGSVKFSELPIVWIKSTRNNTISSATDWKGSTTIYSRSGGTEGFRNAKKSTSVAAQAAGFSLGERLNNAGIGSVRVVVKGVGNGKLPCIKGLQMAGVNIVSITDNTMPKYLCGRPKGARRV